jgi:hypothetical protein
MPIEPAICKLHSLVIMTLLPRWQYHFPERGKRQYLSQIVMNWAANYAGVALGESTAITFKSDYSPPTGLPVFIQNPP